MDYTIKQLAPKNAVDLCIQTTQQSAIAILLAPRLGDSLLILTIAKNLQQAGYSVSVFGDYAMALTAWLPDLEVHPSLQANQATETLAPFALVLQMHIDWPFDLRPHHSHTIYYDALVEVTGRHFNKLKQIVLFCHHFLGLEKPSPDNGIRSPDMRLWRSQTRRIVLHPTSTGEQRCWAPKHFKTLALRLQKQGFEPHFIMSPSERSDWQWVEDLGLGLPELSNLSAVAQFIHESAWFIGNESGIGHLASCLGIPTLSLTGRPTRTRCWLPSWSPSDFVYPKWLIGGHLRDRYWRNALSPSEVLWAFAKFRRQIETGLQPPPHLNQP